MPDADGYALLQALRALPEDRFRDIPAIAITAYAREEDRQHALTVGFQAHLAKPFDPSHVVMLIQQLSQEMVPAEDFQELQLPSTSSD